MKIDELTQMVAFLLYFSETNLECNLDIDTIDCECLGGKKEFLVWKGKIRDFYEKENIEETYQEWKAHLDQVLEDKPHWGDCVQQNTACMRCIAEEYLEKAENLLKIISILDIEND